MRKILISINPEHVENILNEVKKFEYRTKVAKSDIDSLIVYSTSPTKKVVAEVKIDAILKDTPETLWLLTHDKSGISKKYFDKYFKDRKVAYAYKLGEIKVFDHPKDLADFGVMHAPQSYVYIYNANMN